jgi:hypothetical protein
MKTLRRRRALETINRGRKMPSPDACQQNKGTAVVTMLPSVIDVGDENREWTRTL